MIENTTGDSKLDTELSDFAREPRAAREERRERRGLPRGPLAARDCFTKARYNAYAGAQWFQTQLAWYFAVDDAPMAPTRNDRFAPICTIHDGWMTYCAELPAGMELPAACAHSAETAKYPDTDGEAVECVATSIENGREIDQHRLVINPSA